MKAYILSLVLILTCDFILAQSGSIDMTFGDAGLSITNIMGVTGDRSQALVTAMDGEKMIIAGKTGEYIAAADPTLLRLLENGAPDPSFGTGGYVLETATDVKCKYYSDLYVYPDGKMIACGALNSKVYIVKYNADGSRDLSFGGGDGVCEAVVAGADMDEFTPMAMQTDGKIVIASVMDNDEILLARFNPNGTPDATFGTGGKITHDVYDYTTMFAQRHQLAIRSDGTIYYFCQVNLFAFTTMSPAVWAFTSTGLVDVSIGVNGFKVYPNPDLVINGAEAMFIDADDNLFISLTRHPTGEIPTRLVVKYKPDLSYDTEFGIAGTAAFYTGDVNVPSNVTAINMQPDGKILLGGEKDYGFDDYLSVCRLLPDGTPDFTFGVDGLAISSGPLDGISTVKRVELTPSGKILQGADVYTPEDDFCVARWNNDPCGMPIPLDVFGITPTSAKVNWEPVVFTDKYKIQYRVLGTVIWTSKNAPGTAEFKKLTGLLCNTTYEWRIKSNCLDGTAGDFSAIETFTTAPCREAMETSSQIWSDGKQIFVELNASQDQIEIYALSGEMVYSSLGNSGMNVINIYLPDGLYIVKAGYEKEKVMIVN